MGAKPLQPGPPSNLPYNSLSKIDSLSASTLSPDKDYIPTSDHPFSPFYSHPTTRTSLEQAKSESKIHIRIYEHDLEGGSRLTQAEAPQQFRKDDAVWPCNDLRKQHELMKSGKGYNPFRRLSTQQKFWVKIIVAILTIGAITGLAVGISKAVGGGVFRTTNNSSAPIGDK